MDPYYTPKRKFWRAEVIRNILVIFGVFSLVIVASGLSLFAYYAKDLPNPNRLNQRQVIQSTRIYDASGQVMLFDIHNSKKRTLVELNQLPSYVGYAAIAAEDENFYQHHGFDLKGILRAFLSNLKALRVTQGGSTITQQLVKNAILSSDRTIARKIKELILSFEIERNFSKDEILQLYLNEIPYGSNVYGIEAAAQTFFNTPASELSLSQAALLATLPKAPSFYSPYGQNQADLITRHQMVLKRLFELGYITGHDYQQAQNEELTFATPNPIKAPHFVMYVKEQLVERFGERRVEEGGLTVYTTLDIDLQQKAETIIAEEGQKNEINYNATNAALVAIEPTSGHIKAMIGSRDYFNVNNDGQVNVTTRKRQPGSSMKPYAYLTAFKADYTPDTIVFDLSTDFGPDGQGNDYIPNNYDNKHRGPLSFRQCIQMSVNVCSVKVLYLAGIKDTLKTAQDLGITSLVDSSRFGLSLVLGGGEVTPLEHTAAYGALANNGLLNPTIAITKVVDNSGRIVFEARSDPKQVVETGLAHTMTDVLSDNQARAPVFGLNSNLYLGARPVAAKTGTTQEFRDAWLVGYTPQLSVGVWSGNNDNTPMKDGSSGGRVAGPIWNRFMREAHQDKPIVEFAPARPNLSPRATGVTTVKLDKITGKLATELTPAHLVEEKVFHQVHSVLYYIDQNDEQFPRWEEPVLKWAQQRNYNASIPTEYDDVHTKENQPKLKITNLSTSAGNLRLDVKAEAPLDIKQVDFFLDGNLLSTDRVAPYSSFTPLLPDLTGEHLITIKAYDTVYNVGTISRKLKLD